MTIIAKSVTVKNEKKPQSLLFWEDGHIHPMEYFKEVKSECVIMDPFHKSMLSQKSMMQQETYSKIIFI